MTFSRHSATFLLMFWFCVVFGQGSGSFTGFTKLCKGLAVVLIGGHILVQLFPAVVNYLALIPARYLVLENLVF